MSLAPVPTQPDPNGYENVQQKLKVSVDQQRAKPRALPLHIADLENQGGGRKIRQSDDFNLRKKGKKPHNRVAGIEALHGYDCTDGLVGVSGVPL